jgi:hypothetical protein
MELVLFDSGSGALKRSTELETIPASRPLRYAKIGACYLDIAEWFVERGRVGGWTNLETDMLFIRPGFTNWMLEHLRSADYVAARFGPVPPGSRWRPARSLRAEGRTRLLDLLGGDQLYGAFSPGQVFSAAFSERIVGDPRFSEIRAFAQLNERDGGAYSLQETIFPTAAMAWGMRVGSYPESGRFANRYRPYFGVSGTIRARADADVFFVHPVRRSPSDPARQALVESLGEN